MLEIVLLVVLTRRVGEIVKAKGRRPGRYKLMTVLLWIGGEVAGSVFGGIVAALTDTGALFAYLFALAGAAAGAGLSFLIARNVTPAAYDRPPQPPVFG